jgi:hypothetical protein
MHAKYGARRTVDLAVSSRQGSGERESGPLISEAIRACVSNIPLIYISLILLVLQSGGWFEICCTRKRCMLMLRNNSHEWCFLFRLFECQFHVPFETFLAKFNQNFRIPSRVSKLLQGIPSSHYRAQILRS